MLFQIVLKDAGLARHSLQSCVEIVEYVCQESVVAIIWGEEENQQKEVREAEAGEWETIKSNDYVCVGISQWIYFCAKQISIKYQKRVEGSLIYKLQSQTVFFSFDQT